jgi:hypothetical protein
MKKALLIGINYYDISNITLNGCIHDIINIKNMLIDAYGYNNDNIIMLRDDLPENPPIKENILNKMRSIIAESLNFEELWIHYSGHGSKIQGHHRNNEDESDEVLVPLDFETKGFIVDNDLLEIIKDAKCRTIIVTDCCHSEAMFELPWSFEYIKDTDSIVKTKRNSEVLQETHIFMFSGCKDTQTSADIFNKETSEYTGAFTSGFIYCLKSHQYNMGFIDLYKHVYQYLQENGYSQKPIFSSSIENPDGFFSREPLQATTL